jgi:hypothetical protein
MVSSISSLLRVVPDDARYPPRPFSNVYATDEPGRTWGEQFRLLPCLVALALIAGAHDVAAQQETSLRSVNRTAAVGAFVGGLAVGLVAHETGHVLFDVIFDANPRITRVEFHGIPFFAITHDAGLPPRQEFTISSAGFWVQHATNEWLLTRNPRLRSAAGPFTKGVFAFNVGASMAYSVAAFGRTGPVERDTRGMADAAQVNERWIGALILAPAILDSWRYFDPEAKWPVWVSRAVKIGGLLLIFR